jgi:hypothetical protein
MGSRGRTSTTGLAGRDPAARARTATGLTATGLTARARTTPARTTPALTTPALTALVLTGLIVTAVTGCSSGGLFPSGSGSTTAASTGSGSSSAAPDRLPDGVGKGLKYAVDAAASAGFSTYSTHDASGRMRAQVLYTDWKVCFQTPPAGLHPSSTKVDFGVVKLAESCPASDQGLVTVTAGATMPDLRGRSVRYASDVLGSGASIRFTTTTGADAHVLVDSNWQVCGQTPAPGAAYAGVPVTLVVAKYSDGGCPATP